MRTDEAEAAYEEEENLGDAAGQRPDAIPETQVRGRAPTGDDEGRSKARDQHRARRVGPLVIHGQRVRRHVVQHAADDRSRKEGRARTRQHGHQSRQADHPHGHEGQGGHVGSLDNRVVAGEERDERVPARRVVDAPPTVEFMETTERAGILAVEDRVNAILMERRIPLLDGVRWICNRQQRPSRQEEAHEDRAPCRRADGRLMSTDRHAHTDGLAERHPVEGKSTVNSVKVAEAPRDRTADGAHAEDRHDRGSLPRDLKRRIEDRQDSDQAKGERRCRPDRDERRAHPRAQPHEPRQHQGDHHGQQGRNQHPPGQHVLLLLSRRPTLADHLNDDG